MALDFAGAVPDAFDTRIAPEALQGQFLHEAHATKNLDSMVGHPAEHLRGVELCHGKILILRSITRLEISRAQHQQRGGLKFRCHIGELEGRTLELADGLAELLARRRPFRCQIQHPARTADAVSRNRKSGCAEPLIGDIKSLVLFLKSGASLKNLKILYSLKLQSK